MNMVRIDFSIISDSGGFFSINGLTEMACIPQIGDYVNFIYDETHWKNEEHMALISELTKNFLVKKRIICAGLKCHPQIILSDLNVTCEEEAKLVGSYFEAAFDFNFDFG